MTQSHSKAGLYNFTKLLNVEGWLIERKVFLENDKIICRASIPDHASWYGSRIRLNKDGELVIPYWISSDEKTKESTLIKVRNSLMKCRKGIFNFLED